MIIFDSLHEIHFFPQLCVNCTAVMMFEPPASSYCFLGNNIDMFSIIVLQFEIQMCFTLLMTFKRANFHMPGFSAKWSE